MAKKFVTRIVPVVKTWWGGEPVQVKFILKIDKSDCTLEIVDYKVFGWGVDNTVEAFDISLGVSFDVDVNYTEPECEPCELPADTCKKVINVIITVIKTTSVLGKEFQTSLNDVTGSFTTGCYAECCCEAED